MVEAEKKLSSHWWWFDSQRSSQTTPKRSTWLQSTLAELDEKTMAMLRIIEDDADSFAKRAEMYYKKRPELITMVEEFYRAHRSLAEQYDQVKSETRFRLTTPWESPLSFKSRKERCMSPMEKSYDSYSETYDPMESGESEVDDPEQEEEKYGDQSDKEISETGEDEVSSRVDKDCDYVTKLKEEIERLEEENRVQKQQLEEKDEEKREVIRQLSLAMDVLKEENVNLRKCVANKESPKRGSPSEFNKLKGMFLEKLFNGSPKSKLSVVAL
ncbi:hypothetical protein NMG60_11034928 [Bertholletia excelsa]